MIGKCFRKSKVFWSVLGSSFSRYLEMNSADKSGFNYLSLSLTISPSIHPSIHLSIYLSIYPNAGSSRWKRLWKSLRLLPRSDPIQGRGIGSSAWSSVRMKMGEFKMKDFRNSIWSPILSSRLLVPCWIWRDHVHPIVVPPFSQGSTSRAIELHAAHVMRVGYHFLFRRSFSFRFKMDWHHLTRLIQDGESTSFWGFFPHVLWKKPRSLTIF